MSDDGLVRRLRRGQNQAEHAAADRIEELETALPLIAASPSGKERSEIVRALLGEVSDHE